ncbi:hypothetical protein RTG_02745 [Rhodotorula toruloides ATCC 204091]|uniref:Uncharacterized protein n=1 Tax=Rhodotorula toruloides TaxID=5286 RepID=A0A2T0AHM9_RHOTO|nr:hypothetical protein RTG_02745 [Rhodotorula toruloides ATCC 204091]PRQ77519.1 hypothetical protein AAT19DRAFT_8587 [Rhodotorula toruloides]
MLHPLARLRAASLVLLATLTPLALGNTEILVSRLPFELADLPKAAHSASVSPHILELYSPQTLSIRLTEGQDVPTELIIPLDAAGKAPTGLLGRLDRLERAMGLEMRTVRLSWPASHPTTFHLSTHRAPSSSPDPSLPHLLISATPSFVSPSCDQTLYVPFTILLEPIHFGGVPESTLPFVLVLVGLVGVMGVSGVAGGMGRWLEELAEADWKLGRAGEDEKAD